MVENITRVFIEAITINIFVLLGVGTVIFLLQRFSDKFKKINPNLSFKKASLILIAGILLYVIVLTGVTWVRYETFVPGIFDLGNMEQAMWNTAQGDVLHMTTYYPAESRLFFHVEPIFVLLTPFYVLWQDTKMLLLLQALILALGAVPVFLIAFEKFKQILPSLFLSLSYLMFPALIQGNLFDFHPLVLAPTFILFAFYFLTKRKDSLSFIFFLLAMMCREEIAVMVLLFGLYIFFSKKKKWGLILSTIGLGWFITAYWLIIPTFSPTGEALHYLRYSKFGQSFLEIASYIVTHPLDIFKPLNGLGHFNFLLFLFVPTGLFAILKPKLLLPGIFSFAVIFVNGESALLFGRYQYSTPLVAPLMLATIWGLYYFISKFKKESRQRILLTATAGILLINILLLIFNQWNSLSFADAIKRRQSDEYIAAANEVFKLIPDDASVVASWRLGTHLADRRELYLIDTPMRAKADYVAVKTTVEIACSFKTGLLKYCEATPEDYQIYIEEIRNNSNYKLIFNKEEILLFKKIAN